MTTQTQTVADERASFEAHFMAEGWNERSFERYDIYDPDDTRLYKSRHVNDMWDGWQARAALAQPAAVKAGGLSATLQRIKAITYEVSPPVGSEYFTIRDLCSEALNGDRATAAGATSAAEPNERATWNTKQWYEHVGAWETPEGFVSFGSVMAVRAMLIQFGRAMQPTAPVSPAIGTVSKQPRSIPDAECRQGRCARPTTGCWDKCGLHEVIYPVATHTIDARLSAAITQPSDDECDRIIAQCWSPHLTLQEYMRRVVRAACTTEK